MALFERGLLPQMKITCNLYDQWIRNIRQEMTKVGFDHSALKDQDCAVKWFAWKRRIIPAGKRTILKASSFSCPAHLKNGLANLEGMFKSGGDIWPWQSTLIDDLSFEDGMFNDFRVMHFHMGNSIMQNGYVKRTGELLFAILDSKSVYELGIYNHNNWYELDLLDLVDENWPHLLNTVTINVLNTTNHLNTRDEVKEARNAKINFITKLKSGRIIAPLGGGIALNGTSNEAVLSAITWKKKLLGDEKKIIENINEQIQKGKMAPKDYEVMLQCTNEEISGILTEGYKWTLWKKS